MARIRSFPKRYKAFARQTSGLVGGRVEAPAPASFSAPPSKVLYEVGDLVEQNHYKGNRGIITALSKNRYSGDELYEVNFWMPNGERKEYAVTAYSVVRLKTAREYNLAKAQAKVKIAAAARARAQEQARPVLTTSPGESTRPTPDYELRGEPGDPWQIPEAWGVRLPASHYAFLRGVNDYQRPDATDRTPPGALAKLATKFGVREVRLQRELTELSTVHLARTTLLPLRRTPAADFGPFLDRLETLYRRQFSLADLRTTTTILNQQYSTPAPLAAILGEWICRKFPLLGQDFGGAMEPPKAPLVLEPTAGNGLLTVRLDPRILAVNELEETRFAHLAVQGYGQLTNRDAVEVLGPRHHGEKSRLYQGVLTNPPFGSTNRKSILHRYGAVDYPLIGWEHVIAAQALQLMADDGRAAIIIGGHHQYDRHGKLAGRDWVFFNYLYAHFNVAALLHLDSQKLYARQGATWPIRVILLDGVKKEPSGFAPVNKEGRPHDVLTTFHQIAQAVGVL